LTAVGGGVADPLLESPLPADLRRELLSCDTQLSKEDRDDALALQYQSVSHTWPSSRPGAQGAGVGDTRLLRWNDAHTPARRLIVAVWDAAGPGRHFGLTGSCRL